MPKNWWITSCCCGFLIISGAIRSLRRVFRMRWKMNQTKMKFMCVEIAFHYPWNSNKVCLNSLTAILASVSTSAPSYTIHMKHTKQLSILQIFHLRFQFFMMWFLSVVFSSVRHTCMCVCSTFGVQCHSCFSDSRLFFSFEFFF